MIVVLNAEQAGQDVAKGLLVCACGQRFKPWGTARPRTIRQADGARVLVKPGRVRCSGCNVTHVLVPAGCTARGAYAAEVVGRALVAGALGDGHRPIAARLQIPQDTVRGWLRRARSGAEQLRRHTTSMLVAYDPDPPPLEPTRTALGDAVTALVAATVAAARRLRLTDVLFWHLAAMIAAGRLIQPARSG